MFKWLLALALVFSPIIGLGQTSFWTDRAVGVYPVNGIQTLVPIAYGQVRVCTAPASGSHYLG